MIPDYQTIWHVASYAIPAAIGATIGAALFDVWRAGRRRPRMTRFQREILEARMTADDELEYDRIMRALGIGKGREVPQVDSVALYDEAERRYQAKEISLEQYRFEIGELERTYGPTYRAAPHARVFGKGLKPNGSGEPIE